jgi:hypothetical protein
MRSITRILFSFASVNLSTRRRALPPFWLLAPDFLDSYIPQGYQGEALV